MQAEIAQKLFTQTDPLRTSLFGAPAEPAPPNVQQRVAQLDQILGGGDAERFGLFTDAELQELRRERDALTAAPGGRPAVRGILPAFLETGEIPTALEPITGPVREDIESQFGRAREGLLERTPVRGGQLSQALAALETDRARTVSRLRAEFEAPIRQTLFGTAASAALGAPPTAITGLSGAGAQFGQIAARAAQEQQAQGEALGSMGALATKLALSGSFGGGGGGRVAAPATPNPWG